MAVKIAEYLGQSVELNDRISPAKGNELCPFMGDRCSKLKEKNKPICSVRKTNNDLWIVCKHRLCSTIKTIPLTEYQKPILYAIAKTIWGEDVDSKNILIKREVRIPVTSKSGYNADYIMVNNTPNYKLACPSKVVLEMQGGGETSNTGKITEIVNNWENNSNRTNQELGKIVKEAGTIETNAWRRQQEQFIIKGNISIQTGGGIVFCVGKPLFDYLYQRFQDNKLNNLREHNWTLALLCFSETPNNIGNSISFSIDQNRLLFTNYNTFVQALINQGNPFPNMFQGSFENLSGNMVNII